MWWCLLLAQGISGVAVKEHRFEGAIRKFEQRDAERPPEPGGTLFLGSSSIVGWDLARWFPGRGYLNRGFGGSQIDDSVYFFDRVVAPYRPSTIVFYAGDNDIAAGKHPRTVRRDFETFVAMLHGALPETRLLFLSIKPSGRRWRLWPRMCWTNELVRRVCDRDERLEYVDVGSVLIGPDGRPDDALFRPDRLHLNPDGYKLWTGIVGSLLEWLREPAALGGG